MSKNKQMTINLIASLVLMFVNLGINFILSPYIINNIGEEAYGFVSLANNFVNYAMVFTVALNSMASRFITIEIHKNNLKNANEYFNSILYANLIIVGFLIVPAILCVAFLEHLLNISSSILIDVKILFTLVFINFFITLVATVFNIATYCVNKLYLSSIKNINAYLFKALCLIILISFFTPRVSYIGVATLLSSVYLLGANIRLTKKLLPDITFDFKMISFSKIWEIIRSGIWNTITKLSQLLTDGLDLLICNLWISGIAMGQLAIAKTLSSVFGTLIATVSNIFAPTLTIDYAKNDVSEMLHNLKLGMKITGFFTSIPFIGLVVVGKEFLTLWIPNQDIQTIYNLTIITLGGCIISGIINPLYSVYTITNKIKADALVRVGTGFLTIIVVFILLNTTNMGIYAVASVSVIIGFFVNFFFVPTYAAHCLKQKLISFYPLMLRYMGVEFIMLVVFMLIKNVLYLNNWINLFLSCIFLGLVGLLINYLLLFNKYERLYFINILRRKLWKK